MAATIDSLDQHLEKILKVLESSAKAQGVAAPGSGGASQTAPKTLKDHFAAGFQKAAKEGLGVEKMLGNAAGKLSSMSGTGASVAGPLGAVAGPLVGIAVEMAKLPGQIRDFAQGLHDANRQFAQFSPAMAMVMAQSDMRDAMRKMGQGENMAGSAGNLAGSLGDLKDQMAPVDTALQNLQNNFGALLAGAMSEFLEQSEWAQQLADWIEDMSDALEDILEWLHLKKDKDDKDGWEEEIEKMAKAEDFKRMDRTQPVRKPPMPQRPQRGGGDF